MHQPSQNLPPLQAVNTAPDPSQTEWYKRFRRPITKMLAALSKQILSKYLAERK